MRNSVRLLVLLAVIGGIFAAAERLIREPRHCLREGCGGSLVPDDSMPEFNVLKCSKCGWKYDTQTMP